MRNEGRLAMDADGSLQKVVPSHVTQIPATPHVHCQLASYHCRLRHSKLVAAQSQTESMN